FCFCFLPLTYNVFVLFVPFVSSLLAIFLFVIERESSSLRGRCFAVAVAFSCRFGWNEGDDSHRHHRIEYKTKKTRSEREIEIRDTEGEEGMSDLVARTGRHQQRYEAGCRLVSGCIPFRYRNCDDTSDAKPDPEKEVEVLMINSPSGPGLLFPKGGWENDETVEEAAVREALEEAGVRGDIVELELWPEQSTRHRTWVTIPEAAEQCRHPWMRDALLDGFIKWHASTMATPEEDVTPEG
ncbi:unnamed protein product, partial [Musa banksii]